jgi:hypothetical protein
MCRSMLLGACSEAFGACLVTDSVDGNREINAGRLYSSVSVLIMVAGEAHRFPTLVSSRYLSTQA